MVNYGKSMIYKLCCKDTSITDIYIGSTTNFNRRKQEHKHKCNKPTSKLYNSKVYTFIREQGGFENWDIILIENVKVETKRELEKEERRVMDELKPSLNSIKSFLDVEERRIKRNQISSKYNIKTQDKYKQKFNCDCGGKYTYKSSSIHNKTKKHLDFISQ